MSENELGGPAPQTKTNHFGPTKFEKATMVAHFVCALFSGFVIYTAWPGSSLFSWHPTLMVIAFALLMMEAILVFSRNSSLIPRVSRPVKVKVHWIFQVAAGVLALAGLIVIMYNKYINDKPHFTTWHGRLGLATVVYVCIQSLFGPFLLYPQLLKGFRLVDLKMYHATSGLICYALVCGTLVLALYSKWFTSLVTGTSWYACLVCPMILIFVTMEQVTRAYLPSGMKTVTTSQAANEVQNKKQKRGQKNGRK